MNRETVKNWCKGWGFSFTIALLIATSFKSAIADWNDIPTGSMEPTILVGDRVFVNKLAYDLKIPYTTIHLATWDEPRRGDIVVFYSPQDGTRLIKRVVGLPGDTIGLRHNKLFINGTFLQYEEAEAGLSDQDSIDVLSNSAIFKEDLLGHHHIVKIMPEQPSRNTFRPVTIPEGNYFMMGDNRDNSADSRFFGFVERKRIVGRASTVAISRKDSFAHPRWERFFKELI
ncbi:signal peptidase I [Desulfopila sp. IMCC35008]|uniref:signal peptidase I n=1 Tax=Desulfopila sp. IMCC35008 TaxID=2653858 RepID=UPI0013D07CCE|nr:signal peptidase I [Desulfopila sp. IMCC35008]